MKVKIYSTKACPYCVMAKEFFAKKKIAYKEIDVSVHKNADEMIEKSGQMGVPVIEIGKEIIVGFDVPRINEVLGKKKK